ncbi:MAG: N-acetylmuramate 1-kinase [Rhodospirillaceae bacterium]|nr:N-acetylmuramate 1-kinase [Rhodospirillaceae bacterium]
MNPLDRDRDIADFLAGHGWGAAERRPLSGDASFRRYERLALGGRSAVLMDAPPPRENVRPFLAIGRLLREAGFAVPAVYAVDESAGLLLLEDLGDDTYTRLLARGFAERRLYELAVDLLIALHRRLPAERLTGLPVFDETRALEGVQRLLDWYWPAVKRTAAPDSAAADFSAAWRAVLPLWDRVPGGLVLYDYHVDNLMLLPGRDGIAAIGVLDFQDAVRGPQIFDLVSLIDDARRDVPAELAALLIERYLAAFPELDRAGFAAAYALSGAQRHTRIIGTFTRLLRRDGKAGYLRFIPRVWRQLEARLGHPALAPLADWFAEHLPPEQRRVPVDEERLLNSGE